MKFNKILNQVYSSVTSYSTQDDGSISAKYVIGVGTDSDESVTDFTPLISEYKYIDSESAKLVLSAPLSKDDIGKNLNDVMLERIYVLLKERGDIIV